MLACCSGVVTRWLSDLWLSVCLQGKLLQRLDHGRRRVQGLALTADGSALATASVDGKLRVWRPKSKR